MSPPHRLLLLSVTNLAVACAPSLAPAPLDSECTVAVRNASEHVLEVTAFGRRKVPLGRLAPGRETRFGELCRVERVSIRGVPEGGGDPIWIVTILEVGEVVDAVLEA